jgi:hypothetical protein
MRHSLLLVGVTWLLAGCELPIPGLDEASKLAAAREADGRAVGSACRHAGRAIEDCYVNNPKVSKAAIFAGWRDMDGYMRENSIEVVLPESIKEEAAEAKKAAEAGQTKDDKKPGDTAKGSTPSKALFSPDKPAGARKLVS